MDKNKINLSDSHVLLVGFIRKMLIEANSKFQNSLNKIALDVGIPEDKIHLYNLSADGKYLQLREVKNEKKKTSSKSKKRKK